MLMFSLGTVPLMLGLGFGINGVWMGILADQMSRFIFGSVRFKQGNWTKIKI